LRLTPVHFTFIFFTVLSTCIWADRQRGGMLYFGWGNVAFGGFIILTILLEAFTIFWRRIEHKPGWSFASMGAIALAFFIWNMSRTGHPWCDPYSYIQGHAAWHLLDALSVYCLFRYYISERKPAPA